jgi:hypothetical protein
MAVRETEAVAEGGKYLNDWDAGMRFSESCVQSFL